MFVGFIDSGIELWVGVKSFYIEIKSTYGILRRFRLIERHGYVVWQEAEVKVRTELHKPC
jgi:hypothetical protein